MEGYRKKTEDGKRERGQKGKAEIKWEVQGMERVGDIQGVLGGWGGGGGGGGGWRNKI